MEGHGWSRIHTVHTDSHFTVFCLKSENPAAPHEDSVQVHGQDGEAKDLVNLCGGVALANVYNTCEQTCERKKRCKEMRRDVKRWLSNNAQPVPACACTPLHVMHFTWIHCSLLHGRQRKLLRLGHCMGPPLWKSDSWPRPHRNSIPIDSLTNTHTQSWH